MLHIVYRGKKKIVIIITVKYDKYLWIKQKGEIIFLSSTFHGSTSINLYGLKHKAV